MAFGSADAIPITHITRMIKAAVLERIVKYSGFVI
jgi:hypothetical protein